MASIVTMCEICAKQYAEVFRVKAYPGKPTTEKRKICEVCKKNLPADLLKQYVVSGKGGK